MNITGGVILVPVNTSASPQYTTFTVNGTITNSGGTLSLTNAGPALAANTKLTIFSQAVSNGAAMVIVSPGLSVVNNLQVDGSVSVSQAVVGGQKLSVTVSGGQINLTWPTAGVHLEMQTDALAQGIGTNWVVVAGTQSGTTYSAPINTSTNIAVFFRLAP